MAQQTVTTCDKCRKDLTMGNGRAWRLMVMGEAIQMDPKTTARHDAARAPLQHHFCDEKCAADFLASAEAAKFAAENEHQAVREKMLTQAAERQKSTTT